MKVRMPKKSTKKTTAEQPTLAEQSPAVSSVAPPAPPVKKEDGGPAFPLSRSQQAVEFKWGMSLRDYFAGQAMASIVAAKLGENSELYGHPDGLLSKADGYAGVAYAIADAMLVARKR